MAKLTVRGIEALKPKSSGSYRVTVHRGAIPARRNGRHQDLVRSMPGRRRQLQARLPRHYGSAGDPAHISLAQAVAENARMQALAGDGIDFEARRAEAARKPREPPFATCSKPGSHMG